MQAKDLLSALVLPPTKTDYQGIYHPDGKTAFTGCRLTQENMCFFTEKGQPPLTMQDLLVSLMTNKTRELYYWDQDHFQPIYGFKEDQGKIIF